MHQASTPTIKIGGLGPLALPGLEWAGRDLHDAMTLAVTNLNQGPGVLGRQVVLQFEDTRGEPQAGIDAVTRLAASGVHAFAGEFHSMVTDAIIEPIEQTGLPFVCASATMDSLTARRASCLFRLSAPQSLGWNVYADFLLAEGVRHAAVLQDDNAYWNNGPSIIERKLTDAGARCTRISTRVGEAASGAWLTQLGRLIPAPDCALLLMGYPEPLGSVFRALRTGGLAGDHLVIGDPAGRVAGPDWPDVAGPADHTVPYLAYVEPGNLTGIGRQVATQFKAKTGRDPTFVALEGYDAILVLAHAFDMAATTEPAAVLAALRAGAVPGTRGSIRFKTEPEGVAHQQWTWPPVSVVAHAPSGRSGPGARLLWPRD